MSEREAFYAAIEAAPEDFGLYLIFADWLRDRGEDDLADGFAAMGRLRRRPMRCPEEDSPTGIRWQWYSGWFYKFGDFNELPGQWSDSLGNKHKAYELPTALNNAAVAYSRLATWQKEQTERLLARQEEHECPFSPDRRPTPT